MISNVYIDGVKITDDNCFLTSVSGGGYPSIDVKSYVRGGRSGVVVGTPFYRSFLIGLEFTIFGSSIDETIQKRDDLISRFGIGETLKTLRFDLTNGDKKQVDVVFSKIVSSIMPENINHLKLAVTAIAEKEFFEGVIENQDRLNVYDGGGFTIPFAIPFSMNVTGNTTSLVVTNNGNANYFPIIKVYGDLSTFSIKNETIGKTLQYLDTLGNTDVLMLNCYERTAVLNNANNVLSNVTGDWLEIKNGDNIFKLTATSGSGYAMIYYKNAWRNL